MSSSGRGSTVMNVAYANGQQMPGLAVAQLLVSHMQAVYVNGNVKLKSESLRTFERYESACDEPRRWRPYQGHSSYPGEEG